MQEEGELLAELIEMEGREEGERLAVETTIKAHLVRCLRRRRSQPMKDEGQPAASGELAENLRYLANIHASNAEMSLLKRAADTIDALERRVRELERPRYTAQEGIADKRP
jgi:hypothetical protein